MGIDRIRLTDASQSKFPRLVRGFLIAFAYMKRAEMAFTLVLLPFDFLALVAAAIAAYYARFHPLFTSVRPVTFTLSLGEFLPIIYPIALVWLGVFALLGLYTTKRTAITTELVRVAFASSASMAVVFAILFFSRSLFESRFIAVAAWIFAIALVCLVRVAVRLAQRHLLTLGVGVRYIMLIGKGTTRKRLEEAFAKDRRYGFQVIYTSPTFSKTAQSTALTHIHEGTLDEIFLTDSTHDRESVLDILTFAEIHHIGFRYSADLTEAAIGRSRAHTLEGVPIIEVQKTPLEGWGAVYKRVFDILVSSLLILVLSPVMLLVAIAIKLDSKGPIFFRYLDNRQRATRIGIHGTPFPYFKFRSMKPGTHSLRYTTLAAQDTRRGGPLVKPKNDPRVTRVGKWIRSLSLDELPELFLVLSGHMSLVGPRPHLPEEVEKYKPIQRKVLTIKPGITGLSQVSGREHLDFNEEVRLDVYYIEHWSPWFDLVILLKTPFVVFSGRAS